MDDETVRYVELADPIKVAPLTRQQALDAYLATGLS